MQSVHAVERSSPTSFRDKFTGREGRSEGDGQYFFHYYHLLFMDDA